MAELNHVECAFDLPVDLGSALAAHLQGKAYILGDRQMRKQGVVLENEADVALVYRRFRLIAAVDEQAALRWQDQPADHLQQGGLAGARRPEKRQELAGLDRDVRGLESNGGAVALGQSVDEKFWASGLFGLREHQISP